MQWLKQVHDFSARKLLRGVTSAPKAIEGPGFFHPPALFSPGALSAVVCPALDSFYFG